MKSAKSTKKVMKKTVKKTKPRTKKIIKKEEPKSSKLRWKKTTLGVHYHNKKAYRKGDILLCEEHKLSSLLQRHFVCLDEIPKEVDEGKTLKVQELENGKFNVLNPDTEKPINEKELDKKEADDLVGDVIEETKEA